MRRILMIFALFFMLLNVANAFYINESWENLAVDMSHNCNAAPITFTVYNKTEYEDYDRIFDNLCVEGCQEDYCDKEDGDDCIRCERDCTEFQEIAGEYIIYKGISEIAGVMFEGELDDERQFIETFPNQGEYLMYIIPEDESLLNTYEGFVEIYDCLIENESNFREVDETGEELPIVAEVPVQLLNLSIVVRDTNLQGGDGVDFSDSVALPVDLANSNTVFQLRLDTQEFSSIEFSRPFIQANNTVLGVYLYDEDLSSWGELDFTYENNNVNFNSDKTGIFSITQRAFTQEELAAKEAEILAQQQAQEQAAAELEAQQQAQEQASSESQTQQTSTETITPTSDEGGSNTMMIVGGVILLLVLVGGGVMMMGGKSKQPEAAPPQVITTYQQTYQKTKEYVQKYKDEYLKDQIYRSLKEASVPKDIIDKVFAEEY